MDKMARLQALEAELARRKASRAKFENAVAANRASVGDASFINYFQQRKDSEERERLQRVANESEKARQKYEAERIAKANAQTYLDELAKDYYTTSIDLESIPDVESSARAKTERYLDYIRDKAEKLAAEHGLSLPADFASKAKTEPTPKPTDANAVVLKNFLETKKNAGTLTDADVDMAIKSVQASYSESPEMVNIVNGLKEYKQYTAEAKQKKSQARAKEKRIKELSDQLDLAEKRGNYREAVRIKEEIKRLLEN